MNFNDCMAFLNSYTKSGGKITDLSRAENLMKLIGNPEKRLKFIHIAGTNGKGSTLGYISDALILAGYKTGQFTSPFVLHYNDRIRINNKEIDNQSLCTICSEIAERIDDMPYSQFEITMAIAFLWYERENVDVVVLETGIGGLLDCTNVIPPPIVSVITSISLDHTALLGNTVSEIAFHKAGIIKENSAVVLSADNSDEVAEIVRNKADSVNAEFIRPSESPEIFSNSVSGTEFIYGNKPYSTAMFGEHQAYNAVTAIEVCKYLKRKGFRIDDDIVYNALSNTKIMARVQFIEGSPPVIVDGGHNIEGVRSLIEALEDIKEKFPYFYMVTGMVDSKDFKNCVELIARHADALFAVEGFAPNAVPAEKIAKTADFFTESVTGTLKESVKQAESLALQNGGIVVICGSLYLASEYLNSIREK